MKPYGLKVHANDLDAGPDIQKGRARKANKDASANGLSEPAQTEIAREVDAACPARCRKCGTIHVENPADPDYGL